ncbi:hypothetical protein PIB30_046883 [Stylosanthes scabra]|uniref:DUF4283 domain-containing protein n=1 Tax=Stylosanthes scabra TaxID=79078 RepID=A0ABU6TGD7_9FABA|nr:hypothetical protein [Stylosanthes scabra]
MRKLAMQAEGIRERVSGKCVSGERRMGLGYDKQSWRDALIRTRGINDSTGIQTSWQCGGRLSEVKDWRKKLVSFIRYDSKGGATRAMEKLNGTYVAGRAIKVVEARARGSGKSAGWKRVSTSNMRWEGNQKKKGVSEPVEQKDHSRRMKEVEVKESESQRELLDRSIIAEAFHPIRFGAVVKRLDKLEEKYGKIECRDFDPKKCILSMDTIELRNRALADGVFLDIFDEVTVFWGYKWAFSRRVCLELMGLPLHVWSKETFETIAKGFDAKLVMLDEITENRRSFSVARVLVDCFQWEPIQEWITVKCGGIPFQVYVKEFGCEMLSRQVHPDDISKGGTMEVNSASESTVNRDDVQARDEEDGMFISGNMNQHRTVNVEEAIDGSKNRDVDSVDNDECMHVVADNVLMSEENERERWMEIVDEENGPHNREAVHNRVGPVTNVAQNENEDVMSPLKLSGMQLCRWPSGSCISPKGKSCMTEEARVRSLQRA